MSSSTAVGKSPASESTEDSNVIFAAVISKNPDADSFPCYWLIPSSSSNDATHAVKAEEIAKVTAKVLCDPLLESLWLSELKDMERFPRTVDQSGIH
jgi:hypothetical protein